ncbi:MFS transporter [Clostridium beijerinckii]|uniref:MFS family arabinose efflux permease n=1 Tax=Clostridium beijerinckii TaxID=1520 RepID=A0AAX0B3M0_CLOBE|nr:MFS transporter [Clostridium beijerinckii]MBA8937686.1 putative MFS family arabinose efflux permease [Clostridium beijerinckii]NRT33064.1 putative MFS family arabinose efflux permease [Clostridium beijerinckii]NRT47511.1 putative MFS family arabinose efflux permease [Clostridium beijerinckii]NRT89631.1 putative MFS family arabinose efflux permease [Clostridium beijerinckii]NRU41223.1 putative MFS family arabinose efflux permease [Clostridium beijerinckii]
MYQSTNAVLKTNSSIDNANTRPILTKLLILVMSIACGLTVANLYYIQPLLGDIAKTFHVDQLSIGFAAMLTQIGYAIGMIFILPLGDIKEKRNLIVIMLLFSVISLMSMFFSSNIYILTISSFAVGFTSIIPQLIIPLAAQFSNPQQRGQTIGTIMSGLLIGILLSRTVSGILGSYLGWRIVYLIAAIMMFALMLILRKLIPLCNPISDIKYSELLKSMIHLIKTEPILRESSLNGALMFSAFSAFWTSLIFLLESSHYNMGAEAAGLLGLVGVSGALAAPLVGKVADKRGSRFAIGICIVVVIVSYLLFFLFGFKIWGLVLGVILLDLGVQSCNVSNQARVHSLNEETRNRLNTIYMVSFFLGGAFGSFLGSYSYSHFGWYGVCTFGIITQILALIIHKISKKA